MLLASTGKVRFATQELLVFIFYAMTPPPVSSQLPPIFMQHLLEEVPTGIVLVQVQFTTRDELFTTSFPIVFANRAAAHILDCGDTSALLGQDIRALPPLQHAEELHDTLQLAIGQTLTIPLQRDQEVRAIVELHVSPLARHSSRPTHILCSFSDVTDLIQTNDALLQEKEELEKNIATRTKDLQEFIDEIRNELRERRILEAELRMAEQRYRSLARNFPNGAVVLLDSTGHCLLCEGELAEIISLTVEESGKVRLDTVLEDRIKTELEEAFHGKQFSFELQLGSEPFSVHIVPVEIEQRKIDAVMMVLQNIHDFKTRQELEQEREMTALKYRFVTIASHELRTPLAGMMLSSGILRRYWDTTSEDDKLEAIRDIITGLDRMSKLVDDILFVGKSEAGKLPFHPVKMDIAALCREYLDECAKGIALRHRTIRELPSAPLLIFADTKLLQLIVNNLLTNAYKYSSEGSEVRVSLRVEDSPTSLGEQNVIVSVQDSGIGIPEEDIPNLFKSFTRASNVGEIQGTGLGLAMVERAVEQHNGRISVRSVVGKGTTFEVVLPRHLREI
ncbi:MAG: PAS domain-containing sensor histidine kinase [Candidatus Kapaibacterium sp.]|nr:MAG: PAS domain-containing sensor histidine kinase [Candidatus Kapabacteria bacterium]